MRWKEDFIRQRGKAAYEKKLAQSKAWNEAHPEIMAEVDHEKNRKGGKHYAKKLEYQKTGIPGEKQAIRNKHGIQWNQYKRIIAPESQIHHQWRLNSADYDGVALVEADPHMHGFVDIIRILEGKITLPTEEAIRNGK